MGQAGGDTGGDRPKSHDNGRSSKSKTQSQVGKDITVQDNESVLVRFSRETESLGLWGAETEVWRKRRGGWRSR